jgi:hypothetical protein
MLLHSLCSSNLYSALPSVCFQTLGINRRQAVAAISISIKWRGFVLLAIRQSHPAEQNTIPTSSEPILFFDPSAIPKPKVTNDSPAISSSKLASVSMVVLLKPESERCFCIPISWRELPAIIETHKVDLNCYVKEQIIRVLIIPQRLTLLKRYRPHIRICFGFPCRTMFLRRCSAQQSSKAKALIQSVSGIFSLSQASLIPALVPN